MHKRGSLGVTRWSRLAGFSVFSKGAQRRNCGSLSPSTHSTPAFEDACSALHVSADVSDNRVVTSGADCTPIVGGEFTALHLAAQNGWVEATLNCVNSASNIAEANKTFVDALTERGETPLHFAAFGGHTEVVKVLLAHGADVEAKDTFFGCTALQFACTRPGNREVLEALLQGAATGGTSNQPKKADAMSRNFEGFLPGHNITLHGDEAMLETYCALMHRRQRSEKPIAKGSQGQDMEPASRPLDSFGAFFDGMRTSLDWTMLHMAAKHGDLAKCKILARYGCDAKLYNSDAWTTLHHAANGGHTEVVRWLMKECKVDPNVKNLGGGWYPMHIAALKCSLGVVQGLMEGGADPNVRTQTGWTPLHCAAQKHCPELISYLLDQESVDINAVTPCGWTAVKLAAHNGRTEIVELFLSKGADVISQVGDGWSALHNCACTRKPKSASEFEPVVTDEDYVRMGRMLVDAGALPNQRTNLGWTPLHTAARGGFVDLVQMLLEAGADVNSRTGEGWSSLHLAVGTAAGDAVATVRILMEHGADPNVKTHAGKHSVFSFLAHLRDRETARRLDLELRRGIDQQRAAGSPRTKEPEAKEEGAYVPQLHSVLSTRAREVQMKAALANFRVRGSGLQTEDPSYRRGDIKGYKGIMELLDISMDLGYSRNQQDMQSVHRTVWRMSDWLHIHIGSGTDIREGYVPMLDEVYVVARSFASKTMQANSSYTNFGKCLVNLYSCVRTELFDMRDAVNGLDGRLIVQLVAIPKTIPSGQEATILNHSIQFGPEDYGVNICERFKFGARLSWKCMWTGKVERLFMHGPKRGTEAVEFPERGGLPSNSELRGSKFMPPTSSQASGDSTTNTNSEASDSEWVTDTAFQLLSVNTTSVECVKSVKTTLKKLLLERGALTSRVLQREGSMHGLPEKNGVSRSGFHKKTYQRGEPLRSTAGSDTSDDMHKDATLVSASLGADGSAILAEEEDEMRLGIGEAYYSLIDKQREVLMKHGEDPSIERLRQIFQTSTSIF